MGIYLYQGGQLARSRRTWNIAPDRCWVSAATMTQGPNGKESGKDGTEAVDQDSFAIADTRFDSNDNGNEEEEEDDDDEKRTHELHVSIQSRGYAEPVSRLGR